MEVFKRYLVVRRQRKRLQLVQLRSDFRRMLAGKLGNDRLRAQTFSRD
jgi:hypothetical protein